MNIYLVRHGDAEKSTVERKDLDRELTPLGKTATRSAARYWKKIITSFDYIISSPYQRALQTSEIIAEEFGMGNEVIIDKKLSPGSTTQDIIEIIRAFSCENIALVGHQPDMAEHISGLISASYTKIGFKKSSIAKISFGSRIKPGKGTLEFLIPADLFTSE